MGDRILVAMSGGVDSSVAAALLHEQGHEVIGVTLHLWDAQGDSQVGRCCAPEDRDDARRTCEVLGVPHYVIDERAEFKAAVVDPFIEENLAGRTPIPCVKCNQHVKLDRLVRLADELGAGQVATGHYCRVQSDGDASTLLRGRDHNKDQSYFLFGVAQHVLRRLAFPLGDLDKDAARREGQRLGLPNWNKPDSQELCFVPDGDVSGFIARHNAGAARPGPIEDEAGVALGGHGGIEGFTVGQRRGIRVPGPEPRYVLRVVPADDRVVVGPADRLLADRLTAQNVCWIGAPPEGPVQAQVRIRYRHTPASATVTPSLDGFEARFDEPQRAISPGQAAVIYAGDRVLGGGYIA